MKITHGKFIIEFDYSPSEPETEWYPGREEEIEILSVFMGDVDLLDELPSYVYDPLKDWAEDRAWEYIKNDFVGYGD